jgi:DNA-binding response OmpR family regulator
VTKILIAEDEPAILDALSFTLRGEGFDIDAVEDGEAALEAARGRAYDLLILDLMLPKLSGADDYVTKPFAMDELVGRVRALLRRRDLDRQGPTGGLRAGGLEIDAYRHRVVVDGEQRPLTPSEFKLLSLLASEPGRVFTRREIMQHLWDSRYVGDQRACDIHVSNLRAKLGAERIETVRGVGYRLVTV